MIFGGFFCGPFLVILKDVGLTGRDLLSVVFCRDAGKSTVSVFIPRRELAANDAPSIVEYATRDQAQAAVATLSNQNLMGRLVYVREVSRTTESRQGYMLTLCRTVRPSLDLDPLPELLAADLAAVWDPATTSVLVPDRPTAVLRVVFREWRPAVVAVAARSTLPTLVPSFCLPSPLSPW